MSGCNISTKDNNKIQIPESDITQKTISTNLTLATTAKIYSMFLQNLWNSNNESAITGLNNGFYCWS